MSQSRFSDSTPYRSIVKDSYTTRDTRAEGETSLEIVVWRIERVADDDDEGTIKDESGNLRYNQILEEALDDEGAAEIAERTQLKSYRDEQGGRAASTVRGYRQNPGRLRPKDEGGLPSSHTGKRVLRRYARSNDLGHFDDDRAVDDGRGPSPEEEGAEPIDLAAMFRAYKLARSIASQQGFVFAPQRGEPVAEEDNERIDDDEIRSDDRPIGDTKAAAFVEKADGSLYEYQIDFDAKDLDQLQDAPPASAL